MTENDPATGGETARAGASTTRRRALAGAGAALVASLAGCGGVDVGQPNDREYERLDVTATYVAADVTLSLPDELPTVDATNNADLLVLPASTGRGAEQAVEWLADGRVVAVLGDAAERTWLAWVDSDAYADAFGGEGRSEARPEPSLVVAAAVGVDVTTHRYSWGDAPTDGDVLEALDGALVAVEEERGQSG